MLVASQPVGTLANDRALRPNVRKTSKAKRYLVLVAEDDDAIRFSASEALVDAGFEVHEAPYADEAVAIMTKRAGEIHALFTDVNMPGSIDGLALAHHSDRHWPWIALLISSGHPRPLTKHAPLGSRFLPKPYHPHQVVGHLKEMLAFS